MHASTIWSTLSEVQAHKAGCGCLHSASVQTPTLIRDESRWLATQTAGLAIPQPRYT